MPYGKEVCSFISYNVADVIILFENIFLYFVADVILTILLFFKTIYYTEVTVGTLLQSFKVILDTGS